MTVSLPLYEDQHRPFYRVLLSESMVDQDWEPLQMAQRYVANAYANGYQVMFWERCAMPDIANAAFQYRFGKINNVSYSVPPDYYGWYVRLQVAEGDVQMDDPNGAAELYNWHTVFLGTVEHQEDIIVPGASYPIGTRIYRCLDLMNLLKRWPINRHGFFANDVANTSYGHPGFNYFSVNGTLLGNRDSVNAWNPCDDAPSSWCHLFNDQNADTKTWDDGDVIDACIQSGLASYPQGQFPLTVNDLAGLLIGTHHWQVNPNDSTFSMLAKILERKRGRGLAFFDWADDTGDPTADIAPVITINPQFVSDITLQDSTVIKGASSAGTTYALDLTGDQRNVDDSFKLGDRFAQAYGYVEVVGEQIEVAVTLDFNANTLQTLWTTDQASAWYAAVASGNWIPDPMGGAVEMTAAMDPTFDPVYHDFCLAQVMPTVAGNGNDGVTHTPFDWQVSDDGTATAGGIPTSPILCELMKDTPFLFASYGTGYRVESRSPPRAFVWISNDHFTDAKYEEGCSLQISHDYMRLLGPDDESTGCRYFCEEVYDTDENYGVAYYFDQIAITVGIRLPHRVRRAMGDPTSLRRLPPIYVPRQRLWIVHEGCIQQLLMDTGSYDEGHTPIRPASEGFYTTADDRPNLDVAINLAWSWYGTDRRTASWQQRSCYEVPWYPDDGTGWADVESPQWQPYIGDMMTTITASGQAWVINTPVTHIHFDATKHMTTWTTDWNDLDFQ